MTKKKAARKIKLQPMILPESVQSINKDLTPTGGLRISNYPGSYGDSNEEKTNSDFTKSSNIGEDNRKRNVRYREDAFYSTPKFVHSLTKLCDGVLDEPAET